MVYCLATAYDDNIHVVCTQYALAFTPSRGWGATGYYAGPRVPDRIMRRVNRPGRAKSQFQTRTAAAAPVATYISAQRDSRRHRTLLARRSGAVSPTRASTESPSCIPKACSHPTTYLTRRLRRRPASARGATNYSVPNWPVSRPPGRVYAGLWLCLAIGGRDDSCCQRHRSFIFESLCRKREEGMASWGCLGSPPTAPLPARSSSKRGETLKHASPVPDAPG